MDRKITCKILDGVLVPLDSQTREWIDGLSDGRVVKLSLSTGPRTRDQNSLIHMIYADIQRQTEWTLKEVTRHCKLQHGVPILLRDDAEFHEMWAGRFVMVDYELQSELMDWLPITRRMNKKQATEYIDAIVMDFSQQGYFIRLPGDQYEA